ncbi:C39 family peptidase [Streptococcus henryi]|uniref:C39 family peptidase n=1 Tax=Streptococcus henryi TaxID=439219 RepID=UPI00035C5A5F|nr:C39 family peptidase [Streptococcus henryi]
MRKVILVLLSIAILSACSSKPSTTGKTDSSKDKVTLEESQSSTKASTSTSTKEEAQSDSQESTSNESVTEQSSVQDNQTQPTPSQEVETGGSSAGVTGGNTSTYTDSTTVENPPMDDETANRLIIGNNNATASTSIQGGQKAILNVSQQYQQTWNWCAPTAVSMILSYKGVSVSQAQLAQDMGTDDSFGTHNANAIQVLNRYLFGYDNPAVGQAGYRLATVTNSSSNSEDMRLFKERLIQNIRDGYPMYYTIDNARMYPGKSGEHNVTGIGYQLTQDGSDIAYVYYLDPSYAVIDPTYGGLKKVTPEELLYAMLTCVEPNYGW